MKFTRKAAITLLSVIFVIVGMFAFNSCGNDECSHEFGEWTVTKQATCLEEGTKERVCSKCNEKETLSIEKGAHAFADATCTAPRTCTVCSATEGEALGHIEKTPATCTEHAVCSRCNQEYGELLAHVFDKEIADDKYLVSEANCQSASVYSKSCVCGAKGSETFTHGEKLAHTFDKEVADEKYLVSAATCQSPSVYSKSCACGEAGSETFTHGEKLAHTFDKEIADDEYLASAATCQSASRYYKSCQCGEAGKETFESGVPLAHNYVEISRTPQTCTDAQTITYKCTNSGCNSQYTETVGDKKGHNIQDVTPTEILVDGTTCEYVLVYICHDCKKEVEGEHVFHHEYIAEITLPATCKTGGQKTLTCDHCTDKQTVDIPIDTETGHKWQKGEVVSGERVDTCLHCGAQKTVKVYDGNNTSETPVREFENQEIELNDANISLDSGVIESIGDKSVTVSADKFVGDDRLDLPVTEEQLKQVGDSPIYNFTINDGSVNISDFGDGLVTVTLPYTLSVGEDVDSIAVWFINENGELEAIKAVYNDGYVTFKTNHFSYYTVTRLTPAERCSLYGHNYVSAVLDGGCTADTYEISVCVRCHDTKTVLVNKATGHSYTEFVEEATCTEDGYTEFTCEKCGYSYRTKINSTGHNWQIKEQSESTCTENGSVTYCCERCDEEYTEFLPKAAHDFTDTVIPPACESEGYTLHQCKNCSYAYKDGITPMLTHSYEHSFVWADDFSSAKLVFVCSNNSEHKIEIDLVVKVETFKGECSDFTRTVYTVSVTYNKINYTDVKTVETGNPSHTFSTEWKYDGENHWHECVCGAKTDIEAHSFGEQTVTMEPTCGKDGEAVQTCACGAKKVTILPATGEHVFVDGVCTNCGALDEGGFYTSLLKSALSMDSLKIELEDLMFKAHIPSKDMPGEWDVIGSIEAVNMAELTVGFEDGIIYGGAKGSFIVFNYDNNGNTLVFNFEAVIEGEYLYIIYEPQEADQQADKTQIKVSVEEFVNGFVNKYISLGDNSYSLVVNFIRETVVGALLQMADANAGTVEPIIEKLFNIIFTTESNADGGYTVKLDADKLKILNEKLYSGSLKDTVEYYFGAGSFEMLAELAKQILGIKLSDIPQYLAQLGVDTDKLVLDINTFCKALGAGDDFDILEILNSQEYRDMTVGMFIFGTGDSSYLTQIDEYIQAMREYSLYSMISGSGADQLKENIGKLIEGAENTDISLIADKSGALKEIVVNSDKFVFEDFNGNYSYDISVSLSAKVNEVSVITWTDIIDEINGNTLIPSDEILGDGGNDTVYGDQGYITYKGVEYKARITVIEKLIIDKSRIISVIIENDCAGWKKYNISFGFKRCIITIEELFDKETGDLKYTLIRNNNTGEVAEAVIEQDAIKVTYADGSVREFSAEEVASVSDFAAAVFGGEGFVSVNGASRGYYFYYNSENDEYSDSSMHDMEYEYIMNSDNCEDGYKKIGHCELCGKTESYSGFAHIVRQEKVELEQFGLCGGSFVIVESCEICNKVMNYSIDDKEGCVWILEEATENGEVFRCEKCGAYKSVITVESPKDENCMYELTETVIYTKDSQEVYRVETTRKIEDHSIIYDFELKGESCTDGYTVHKRCSDCGAVMNDYESYGHEEFLLFSSEKSGFDTCTDHLVEIYGCPCGMKSYINFNKDSFFYNEETERFECKNCPLVLVDRQSTSESGCSLDITRTVEVYFENQQLYSMNIEKTVENHDFSNIQTFSEGNKTVLEISCAVCGVKYTEEIVEAEFLPYENNDYFFEIRYVPEIDGSYNLWLLAEKMNVDVYLYIFNEGAYEEIANYNSFEGSWLSFYLNGGVEYLFRIVTRPETKCSISYMLSIDKNGEGMCEHGKFYDRSVLLGGNTSCEEGVLSLNICSQCSYINYISYQTSHVTDSEQRIDLAGEGACYGEVIVSECACGEKNNFSFYGCENQYTENSYYDEEGRLVRVEVRSCNECGLRYERSYYIVSDENSCIEFYYYTYNISINDKLILTSNTVESVESHDFDISYSLHNPDGTCEDGVTLIYTCKNCNYSYEKEHYSHEMLEKERIDLKNYGCVCGGYVSVYSCPCGQKQDANIDNVLCDFGFHSTPIWIAGVIEGEHRHIGGVDYYYYSADKYICAVTDPETRACGYVIRYATYWLKADGECLAEEYVTWQFGVDEENGTVAYEYTYKTGNTRLYHLYEENSTQEGNVTTVEQICKDCQSTYKTVLKVLLIILAFCLVLN